jgi:hypothetical protein
MHITLDDDLMHLSEIELRAHEAVIDRILYSYLAQEHLLCLSPKQVIKIRSAIQFGPQARRALDIISRRQQDYMASLRNAMWHVSLVPLGSQYAKPPIGRRFFVRPEDSHKWLARRPSLFVENATADGVFLSTLFSVALKNLGWSSDLLVINFMHGGGSTISAIIEDNADQYSVGMCVCDRDTTLNVPPFPRDKTGSLIQAALISKGLLCDDDKSFEICHPFFTFAATHGWSLENYLGPHTLQLFFAENPECVDSFQPILNLFSNFPELSEDEANEWLLINFRSSGQDSKLLADGAKLISKNLQISDDRASQLALLTVPSSAIPFVRAYSKAGRHHRSLIRAIEADIKIFNRDRSIVDLAKCAHVAFAADSKINFA